MSKNLAIPNINEVMNYLFNHEYGYRVCGSSNTDAMIAIEISEDINIRVSLSSITGSLQLNGYFEVRGSVSANKLEVALSIAKDIENIISTGTTGRDLP